MGPGGGPRGIGICHLQGGFLGDFFLSFFFVSELGGFWARALQKLSLGPKPRARAESTATNVYRKKIDTQKVYLGSAFCCVSVATTTGSDGGEETVKKKRIYTHLEVT